jgi:hypothetical protein
MFWLNVTLYNVRENKGTFLTFGQSCPPVFEELIELSYVYVSNFKCKTKTFTKDVSGSKHLTPMLRKAYPSLKKSLSV